jgi:NADPH2 dehydrogenase
VSLLLSPFTVRDTTLRNRVVVSPMCMYSARADGRVTDFHRVHLGSRAAGGAGLVFTEAAAVRPEGRISVHDLGLWTDDQIAGLASVTAIVHEAGARAGIQLAHAGAKAVTDEPAVAPTTAPLLDHAAATALDGPGIAAVITAFAAAADRAKAAGFDVIELHAAHGYLLHQFLSPLTNTRDDEWGGDPTRRRRLLLEVVEAVRERWAGPLFVRVSADDLGGDRTDGTVRTRPHATGGDTVEQYTEVAELLGKAGVDLVDVSSGGLAPSAPEVFAGYQTTMAGRLRAESGVATGAVGLITTPETAEFVLRSGHADLVFLARELLRDPYWPIHAAVALGDDARALAPRQYARAFPAAVA